MNLSETRANDSIFLLPDSPYRGSPSRQPRPLSHSFRAAAQLPPVACYSQLTRPLLWLASPAPLPLGQIWPHWTGTFISTPGPFSELVLQLEDLSRALAHVRSPTIL